MKKYHFNTARWVYSLWASVQVIIWPIKEKNGLELAQKQIRGLPSENHASQRVKSQHETLASMLRRGTDEGND